MNKTEKPALSVVIFARNSVAGLPNCINSIQDLSDDIIVVDWASRDGTGRVAREFDCRVLELEQDTGNDVAWHEVTKKISNDWVLKIQAFQEVKVNDLLNFRNQLNSADNNFLQIPEFLPDSRYDYYYRTAVVNRSGWDTYNPFLDEFVLSGSLFIDDLEIRVNRKDGYKAHVRKILANVETGLLEDENNIELLSRRSYCHKLLNQEDRFNNSVADAIRIMTTIEPEKVIRNYCSVELFGHYANSLLQQKSIASEQVDSLLNLYQNLIPDPRLTVPLALLLHKKGKSDLALTILEKTLTIIWRPVSQTITHSENFLQPVILMLSIIRETQDEERMVNVLLNIYSLIQENGFDPRDLFQYLNDNEPDFFQLIEGILIRKKDEVGI